MLDPNSYVILVHDWCLTLISMLYLYLIDADSYSTLMYKNDRYLIHIWPDVNIIDACLKQLYYTFIWLMLDSYNTLMSKMIGTWLTSGQMWKLIDAWLSCTIPLFDWWLTHTVLKCIKMIGIWYTPGQMYILIDAWLK